MLRVYKSLLTVHNTKHRHIRDRRGVETDSGRKFRWWDSKRSPIRSNNEYNHNKTIRIRGYAHREWRRSVTLNSGVRPSAYRKITAGIVCKAYKCIRATIRWFGSIKNIILGSLHNLKYKFTRVFNMSTTDAMGKPVIGWQCGFLLPLSQPDEESMSKSENTPEEELQFEWMVRPCDTYREEYRDCKSIKARFHQYFVHGETIDCTQWKTDYNNCHLWENYKSPEAFADLIESEKIRRLRRLRAHYENDVWQRRDKPPENWNAPLPKWMDEKNKNSYLKCITEKLKETTGKEVQKSSCTIM